MKLNYVNRTQAMKETTYRIVLQLPLRAVVRNESLDRVRLKSCSVKVNWSPSIIRIQIMKPITCLNPFETSVISMLIHKTIHNIQRPCIFDAFSIAFFFDSSFIM